MMKYLKEHNIYVQKSV